MGIYKINDLPEGSGSITYDDALLFMDNAIPTGTTKQISVENLFKTTKRAAVKTYLDPDISKNYFTPTPDLEPKLTIVGLQPGIYDLRCRALFMGAAPIAYINEPTHSITDGTQSITKIRHTVLSEDGTAFSYTGSTWNYYRNTFEETRTVVLLSNAEAGAGIFGSDVSEAHFFIDPGSDEVAGWFIDIQFIVETETLSETGIVKDVGLRFCSSVDGVNTTLRTGSLIMEKLLL